MSLSLLLLLVCSAQATHFYGTVMTYYPKNTTTSGVTEVVLRYKLNFRSCTDRDTWTCFSGNCGTQSLIVHVVEDSRSEGWCQNEGIMTRRVPTNAPFQLELRGGNWINNIVNGIVLWRAVTLVELRRRSDTGRANRSPQTTILPAVRVPSNCQRDFDLLAFDADGDVVRCRYGNATLAECNPCTPPSVLGLSSTCTLSFTPTNSTISRPYAVQLVMEDFPRQTIILNQTDGSQEVKTPNDAISKLPVQFVLRVDPLVPSCTDGLYLPRFLPPTPANRARLYTPVNQSLEISINAQANISTISELLFSGPYNVNKTSSGSGRFILSWTPSEDEDGESHPICFIVQAVFNSATYHSELRCVIVSVGNDPTVTTTTIPSTTTPITTATMTTPTTTTTQTTTTTTILSTTDPTTTTTPSTTTAPSTITPTTSDSSTQNTIVPPSPSPTPEDTTASATPVTATLHQFVAALRMRISSSFPLSEDDIRNTVIQQIRDELVSQGLPSDITLRLVSSVRLDSTAADATVVTT